MTRTYFLLGGLGLVLCISGAVLWLQSGHNDATSAPHGVWRIEEPSTHSEPATAHPAVLPPTLRAATDLPGVVQNALDKDEVYFASDTPQQRRAAKIKLQGARYVLIEETADDGPVYAVIDLTTEKIVAYIPIGAYAIQIAVDAFVYITPSDEILLYRVDFGGFVDVYQSALGPDETFNSLTDYIPMRPLVQVLNPNELFIGVFDMCTVDSSCGTRVQRTLPLRAATVRLP